MDGLILNNIKPRNLLKIKRYKLEMIGIVERALLICSTPTINFIKFILSMSYNIVLRVSMFCAIFI